MTKDIPKLNLHWKELDILRGLAAILMIINHVGYKTLAPNLTEGGLSGTLVFIGSFAPVLFFFVTGVGFYVVSFTVIFVGLAWSLALCGDSRLKIWENAVSLTGISSLAVVFIHYYLIYLLKLIGIVGLDFLGFSLVTFAVLTTSFFPG